MGIVSEARNFAIKAHSGQVSKSNPENPRIVHSINVGEILKEYELDENVVAAGYLHDVVEETSYGRIDIKKIFGEDIETLVCGVSEFHKSLSREEIEKIKKLDFRHKAVICAEKISDLEDLRILLEIKDEHDFLLFKRECDSKKWYYTEVYNSLIFNENENHHMFVRLKELMKHIFDNKNDGDYIKNLIFNDNIEEYKVLNKIHYRKEEVFKLKKVLSNQIPYVIEFTGTPRTGKTSLINNLEDFFKKKGFAVEVLKEFTTTKKYKKEIYPTLKHKYKDLVYTEIPKHVLKELEESINKNPDIIIIDRSLFDRLIWVERLVLKDVVSNDEYTEYKKLYMPLIKEKIDIIISMYTDSLTALKREYNASLSLEKRTFLNKENVDEYNKALLNMEKLSKQEEINFKLFDTTSKNQREISFEIIDFILTDMKNNLLEKVKKEFN